MKKIIPLLCLAGMMMLAACSNKEEADEKNDGKIVMSAAQFTLTEEPYGEETEVESRAAEALPGTQTVDLGNGIEAEVSIEREQKEAAHKATRATDISNQHYTITAFKSGVGRVGGTLRGTVSGTGATKTFTPDPGTQHEIELPPGTYTFFCFNDKVSDDGSFNYTIQQADAAGALFDYKTVTISGKHYRVNFEMKHQAARMRFELTTYWDITGIKATASANNGITGFIYDDLMSNYAASGGAVTSSEFGFPNATTEAANYTYTSTSDYGYFLCSFFNGVQTASNLKINFTSGSLYGKSLVGKSLPLSGFPRSSLMRNESYKVKIKLFYSYNYLFQDGSVSTLAVGRKAGKTAVAAMISSNKAMALTDAGGTCNWSNSAVKQNVVSTDAFATVYNDMDGFNHTWSAAHSASGVAHANDLNFPAFYQATHYTPLKPLTAGGGMLTSWYLPSIGEWKLAAQAMGGFNPASLTTWPNNTHQAWNDRLVKVISVQAGGTNPVWGSGLPSHGWYWASNEHVNLASAFHVIFYPNSGPHGFGIYFAANPKNLNPMRVRAFIIKVH